MADKISRNFEVRGLFNVVHFTAVHLSKHVLFDTDELVTQLIRTG